MSERNERFDGWAERYDDGSRVRPGSRSRGMRGCSREALAARSAGLGCAVTGVGFSEPVLAQARRNVPGADFRQLDLLGARGGLEHERFNAVVSAYVLHEFDLETKVDLLTRLAALLTPGGRVVVGDVSFLNEKARVAAYEAWRTVWDEDEHYWTAADALPVMRQTGFTVSYRQVSFCAGVYTFR